MKCTFNLKMFLLLGVTLDTQMNYANQKESTEVKFLPHACGFQLSPPHSGVANGETIVFICESENF